MPASFDEWPKSITDDFQNEEGVRNTCDVCADEKDGPADGKTNCLIKNQLRQNVAPNEIRADIEPSPRRSPRIIVLLLLNLLHIRLNLRQDLVRPDCVASGEAVLQDELDDVANLRAYESIDSKLQYLLGIKSRYAWCPVVNDELGDQVCRDLDSCCLKGETEIEGADHGATALGTKRGG